jgi:hypothetical protein
VERTSFPAEGRRGYPASVFQQLLAWHVVSEDALLLFKALNLIL